MFKEKKVSRFINALEISSDDSDEEVSNVSSYESDQSDEKASHKE